MNEADLLACADDHVYVVKSKSLRTKRYAAQG
jgi:hypothetical protein